MVWDCPQILFLLKPVKDRIGGKSMGFEVRQMQMKALAEWSQEYYLISYFAHL